VRADGAADEVVGGGDVGDPVAHRLVDGVLERRRTRVHGDLNRGKEPRVNPCDLLLWFELYDMRDREIKKINANTQMVAFDENRQ